jgi:hypothetical protein
VAKAPDHIRVGRHRDLKGREWEGWARRALFVVPIAILVLALANVFGQHPATTSASALGASVSINAPTSIRGGLIWQARFDIHADHALQHARLVLNSDWLEGNTVNSIEPQPSSETSRNGALELDIGPIPAGERHLLFIWFQTNPTNVGRRTTQASLYDGSRRLLTITRTLTIFP